MTKRFKSIEELWEVCPELKLVMISREQVGRSGRLHKIEGTSTSNNLVVIANLVVALEANRTLETGMAYGISTLAFLAAFQEIMRAEGGRHIAISTDITSTCSRGLLVLGTHLVRRAFRVGPLPRSGVFLDPVKKLANLLPAEAFQRTAPPHLDHLRKPKRSS